ncbi:hypothetical protein GCM10010123_01670 [Pilimelia anulata]|uniref:Fe2OG dioxygenase domain-containing protein n=1 Tax=Pilimelia anulata TaxID=53371 RepID=A0A8J3F7C8_9ACTN|nr:2OG-Fe(II) oxygenase [Pilimelia anulata]GGJ75323.1 hypothetical protein GCM10010123_01670 [Pilimelia anulata]
MTAAVTAPLNLAAIRGATVHTQPWTYAIIGDTFASPAITEALTISYPTHGFKRLSQTGTDKNFTLEARNDITLRGPNDPCPWQQLLRQLTDTPYRNALQALTGADLTDAVLKIAFYRYGPDAWFSPHRDDERKLLSHIFYFNTDWPEDIGGDLLINRSNRMLDTHTRVTPNAGTSVVVVRSDNSWHAVQRVDADAGRTRQSLIAHFYQPGSDVSFYDS